MAAANHTRKPITTDLQLMKLKAESKPYNVRIAHEPGLALRVDVSGTKTFRWDRGAGNKPRIVIHGKYPALSLSKARKIHSTAKQKHQDGAISELEADAPVTVANLAEIFYSDRILPNRKRPEVVRTVLDNDVLPLIGTMKLQSVTTLVVRKVVRQVVERGAVVYAGKVLATLKQMFRFGVSIGAMEFNIAEPLDRIDLGVQDNQRDRVLDSNEIRIFWEALEKAPRLSLQVKVALQLLIILGIRSGELRHAKWSHIKNRTLTIPVANQKLSPRQAKKAKPFDVPLDDFAMDLFGRLHGLDGTWIFPGKTDGPISEKVLGRATARLLKLDDGEFLPIEKFSPHDLRRTMRSNLSRLKVPPHIAERCLNHSLGRIVETYDQHDYLDERTEALKLWSNQVQIILGKHDNVVLMEAV